MVNDWDPKSVLVGKKPMTSPELLVIGAGPTGIAIGAEARRRGVSPLLIDSGPALASVLAFPTNMQFFTTTDLLEIAGVPFSIPEAKPDRRQAVTYYHSVIRQYQLPIASHRRVTSIEKVDEHQFRVRATTDAGEEVFNAPYVAVAMGYFEFPRSLGVPGEDLPWVHSRYLEPYRHFGERVLVVGGGNSAAETALDLWRAGAEVTLVHRGPSIKPTVKYWLKPDFDNRVEEGSVTALYQSRVCSFEDGGWVQLETPNGVRDLKADAAYVLVGYQPKMDLFSDVGVIIDEETLVPTVDSGTCESNVPGLYIAGSLRAGLDTNRIFIENSREHAVRIAQQVAGKLDR